MILEQIEREIALWGGYSLLQGNQGLKLTQDSALLSDFVRLKPGERGLELGTGQGGLYVLTLLRNQAGELDGVERNPEALAVARRNQVRCGLEGRGRLYEGDLRQFQGRAPYQVCLCNPPYGLPGPKPRDAVQRLARGEAGCGIDQLCQALRRLLADKGRFYFCWPPADGTGPQRPWIEPAFPPGCCGLCGIRRTNRPSCCWLWPAGV